MTKKESIALQEQVYKMLQNGYYQKDIAAQLGVSEKTVSGWVKKNDWKNVDNPLMDWLNVEHEIDFLRYFLQASKENQPILKNGTLEFTVRFKYKDEVIEDKTLEYRGFYTEKDAQPTSRKERAQRLIAKGYSQNMTAQIIGVTAQVVGDWVKQYGWKSPVVVVEEPGSTEIKK